MSATKDAATLPDQADVLAQLTQAHADLATAKQSIGTLGSQVTSLTADKTSLQTQLTEANGKITTLTSDVTKLTGERDTLKAENTRLSGETADFNKRLATELAKHGIRTFTPKAVAETPGKKLTATEQVLAARGVKSLEELAKK